jgi:hypothetical protein
MKNIILAGILLFLGQIAHSQSFFGIGLKGGINTQVNKPSDIIIEGENGSTNFGVEKFKFGTQFGGYIRIGNTFSIQPEVLFNSNKTDYRIGESSVGEVIKNEKYNYLDIPVLVGLKLGPIRAQAGPVGHYFLNSTSELTDVAGYEARFKQFTWGWQAGLTIGTGRISADLRYEGNFNNAGDHITFFGDQYHFDNTPGRLIVGLNVALIK